MPGPARRTWLSFCRIDQDNLPQSLLSSYTGALTALLSGEPFGNMFSALSIPIWSVSPESPRTDSPHGRPRFVLNAKLFGSIGFRRSDVNTRGAKRAGNLREEIGEEIGEDRLKSRRNGLTFFSSLLANLN